MHSFFCPLLFKKNKFKKNFKYKNTNFNLYLKSKMRANQCDNDFQLQMIAIFSDNGYYFKLKNF